MSAHELHRERVAHLAAGPGHDEARLVGHPVVEQPGEPAEPWRLDDDLDAVAVFARIAGLGHGPDHVDDRGRVRAPERDPVHAHLLAEALRTVSQLMNVAVVIHLMVSYPSVTGVTEG